MLVDNLIETDILVIGGGLAGMFAAIKARDEGVKVIIAEKNYAGKSGGAVFATNTSIFRPEWGHDLKAWMNQIAVTGDYMNNPEFTEITLKESYERYQDLISWGVKFLKDKNGELISSGKGVLQACRFDWREILPILRKVTLKSGAKIMDRIMITDLLKQDGRIVGAVGFQTQTGDFYVFKARATILCTGTGILGAASVPFAIPTYDGEALAYRAGAEVSGKEWTISGTGPYSYAGTGYGGYGDRKEGETKISLEGKKIIIAPPDWPTRIFVDKYADSKGNKLNRYTLASAIHLGNGPLLLNLDGVTEEDININVNYWGVDARSMSYLTKGGIYQVPVNFEGYIGWAVHCATGVSSTDNNGGTNLPGLFAAGDGYNSKAAGAKYPHGGFGTRNAMVIGTRAARSAAEFAKKSGEITIDTKEVARLKAAAYAPLERQSGFDPRWVKLQLKTITYPYYVWFIKHGDRLKAALTLVEFVKNHLTPMIYARDIHGLRLAHETKGAVQCIEMMLQASIFRTESRGVHYREDYPFRDDPDWLAEVKIKDKEGKMELVRAPLPKKWWPDLKIPYSKRYPLEYLGEEEARKSK